MTLRAAAEQALDTLEHVQAHIGRYDPPVVTTIARAMQPTIDALRAALAAEQPQPETVPVAEVRDGVLVRSSVPTGYTGPLYLAPPPSTPCPHIRSSGGGEWATNWCALAEQPQPEAVAWPKVNGTARMFDNARALMVIMEREPTDDEMRAFDDAIKGWGTSPPSAPEPSEAEDAARYRWLRDPKNADRDEWNMFGPYSSPADIDAAIDDALRAAAAARNTNPA